MPLMGELVNRLEFISSSKGETTFPLYWRIVLKIQIIQSSPLLKLFPKVGIEKQAISWQLCQGKHKRILGTAGREANLLLESLRSI